MATAPRDTPIKTGQDDTAIGVDDDSMAGRRRKGRRGSRKTRRGGAFQFKTQDVNTAAPPPPNAPQGPLGGRRRKSRKGRRTTKKRGGVDWFPSADGKPLPPRPIGYVPSGPPKVVVPGAPPKMYNPYDKPQPSAFDLAASRPLGGKTRRRRSRRGGCWN
jgi:hypothetical protein